jgi:hypothetical protein
MKMQRNYRPSKGYEGIQLKANFWQECEIEQRKESEIE